MTTAIELNDKILAITNKIRNQYPELLKYLEELPVTIPVNDDPEINLKTLNAYYDSLVDMVDGYEEEHVANKTPESDET